MSMMHTGMQSNIPYFTDVPYSDRCSVFTFAVLIKSNAGIRNAANCNADRLSKNISMSASETGEVKSGVKNVTAKQIKNTHTENKATADEVLMLFFNGKYTALRNEYIGTHIMLAVR